VVQLARAFDARMAGEDLLDEGRTGTRQADDEDWVRRRVAPAGAFGKKAGGEERLASADEGRRRIGVMGAACMLDRVARA